MSTDTAAYWRKLAIQAQENAAHLAACAMSGWPFTEPAMRTALVLLDQQLSAQAYALADGRRDMALQLEVQANADR